MTATPRARRNDRRPRGGPTRWLKPGDSSRVRWNRVLTAQARVATGYYQRADVRDCLVDAILQELGRH